VGTKDVCFLLLGFFMFLSDVSHWFSLVLNTRDRMGGLGMKFGSASEEFEDTEDGILG